MSQADIDKIDSDRSKREDKLILALLLLMDDAEEESTQYLHGNLMLPLANVLNRAVPVIAESMAEAHADAYRRLGLITGEDVNLANAGSVDDLAKQYEPTAQTSADAMVATLGQAIADQRQATPDESAKSIVRNAFETAGYTKSETRGLELGVERSIVMASNGGMLAASINSVTVTGLEHVSVLDDGTTVICEERNGLMLPASDPYWVTGCPPLHWNCRSILLPITGDFEPSTWRPSVPALPGFGIAPLWILLATQVA